MDFWRISNHISLSGNGGLKYSARWHLAGRRIVYLAETPAGALLEILVHLELEEDELPRTYTLLHVTVPDDLEVEEIQVPVGDDWKATSTLTRELGDRWLRERSSALARVPSAILPSTFNCLFNPLHERAKDVNIVSVTPTQFDTRLLRRLRTEKSFFELAERFRAASDPRQVQQLGKELGRFVFGE